MIQVNLPKIVSLVDKNKLILDTQKLVVVEAAQGATGIPGSNELVALTDVDIDLLTLADDDFLQYDALTQTWINSQITITADLSNLTDVNIVNLQDNDFLQYDLATQKWINTPITLTADHGDLSGLSDDDHSQYLLLAGRSGGQTVIGGTDSGDDLTLESTSNATKGSIIFGTSVYDEVNNRLGLGTNAPTAKLDILGHNGTEGTATTYPLRVISGVGSNCGFVFERSDALKVLGAFVGSTGTAITFTDTLQRLAIGTNTYADRYSTNWPSNEIMSILPSGRVGVGRTAPASKLDVKTIAIADIGIISRGIAGQTGNLFEVRNSSDAIKMYISADGKIGGGTAAGDDLYLSSTSNATKGTIITDSDIEIALGKKMIFKIS